MRTTEARLNPQAIILEEATERIRVRVKNAFLSREPLSVTSGAVRSIIRAACDKIKIPDLRDAARRSLFDFYARQARYYMSIQPHVREVLIAWAVMTAHTTPQAARMTVSQARNALEVASGTELPPSSPGLSGFGQALKKWHKQYINDNVRPTLDRIARDTPRDPGDVRPETERRNSLRNRAEMEVRYNDHLQQVEDFRENGTKLVIASTHADCSDRCRPWQGRVYSLDGTYGTAPDGRKYIPLETATDVYYTTKAGKRYKNGLLGFNCRHHLVEYKPGFRFPKPSREEEKREYKITLTQRAMERNVRRLRVEADTWRGIDADRAKKATKKATEAYRRYREYSERNDRAYYPERVKLF